MRREKDVHVRRDVPRHDPVHLHVLLRPLVAERLRELPERALRRRVRRHGDPALPERVIVQSVAQNINCMAGEGARTWYVRRLQKLMILPRRRGTMCWPAACARSQHALRFTLMTFSKQNKCQHVATKHF